MFQEEDIPSGERGEDFDATDEESGRDEVWAIDDIDYFPRNFSQLIRMTDFLLKENERRTNADFLNENKDALFSAARKLLESWERFSAEASGREANLAKESIGRLKGFITSNTGENLGSNAQQQIPQGVSRQAEAVFQEANPVEKTEQEIPEAEISDPFQIQILEDQTVECVKEIFSLNSRVRRAVRIQGTAEAMQQMRNVLQAQIDGVYRGLISQWSSLRASEPDNRQVQVYANRWIGETEGEGRLFRLIQENEEEIKRIDKNSNLLPKIAEFTNRYKNILQSVQQKTEEINKDNIFEERERHRSLLAQTQQLSSEIFEYSTDIKRPAELQKLAGEIIKLEQGCQSLRQEDLIAETEIFLDMLFQKGSQIIEGDKPFYEFTKQGGVKTKLSANQLRIVLQQIGEIREGIRGQKEKVQRVGGLTGKTRQRLSERLEGQDGVFSTHEGWLKYAFDIKKEPDTFLQELTEEDKTLEINEDGVVIIPENEVTVEQVEAIKARLEQIEKMMDEEALEKMTQKRAGIPTEMEKNLELFLRQAEEAMNGGKRAPNFTPLATSLQQQCKECGNNGFDPEQVTEDIAQIFFPFSEVLGQQKNGQIPSNFAELENSIATIISRTPEKKKGIFSRNWRLQEITKKAAGLAISVFTSLFG